MAVFYVSHTGSNTAPYDTKANAATTLVTAVSALAADGDEIRIDHTHTGDNALGVDTSWAPLFSCKIFAWDFTSDVPTTMGTAAWLGNSSTNRSVGFTHESGKYLYVYGLTLRTAGSTADSILLGSSGADSVDDVYESCYFWSGNTGSSVIAVGENNSSNSGRVRFQGCTLRFGARTQYISIRAVKLEVINCTISVDGTKTDTLVSVTNNGGSAYFAGCDLSWHGNTGGTALVKYTSANNNHNIVFENCKFASGWTASDADTEPANNDIWVYNCDSGDVHYAFGHYNGFGSCVAYTGVYASDGPTYDGTNKFSWRIDTTAACSKWTPYISPWISTYHGGTSAITPRVEILRDGSATAWKTDEVWGEFSAQATSGSTQSTITDDRATFAEMIAGTAGNQADGMGTGSWTGEGGTAKSLKVERTASVTPAEIGLLKARVFVGAASSTVYVDPQIRAA